VNVANVNLEKLADHETLKKLLLERGIVSEKEYQLVEQQSRATGRELSLNLVTIETINALIRENESSKAAAEPMHKTARFTPTNEIGPIEGHLAGAVSQGDLPGLVEQIFQKAFESRATDIHFDPQDGNRLRVRYRIDGQLHDVLQVPAQAAASIVSRIKILASLDIIEKRQAQDGHILHHHDGRDLNLRVATVPTNRGERLAVRILDDQRVLVGLDKLGLTPQQTEALERLIHKHHINDPAMNVMSIEDPVEYSLPGVNQLQVDAKIDWTFPKALRAMLRQDPDVMMVGEIRDDETAKIAIRASLTGVLVLTSMHANDAASTIGTLYNYGIPGYLISTSLLGVVAQRLVRRINPEAVEEFEADERMRELLKLEPDQYPGLRLKRGRGTPEDFWTGYRGPASLKSWR
jgi:type IV pilus assembly protein PilB